MELAQSLSSYNHILFPHCPCDARKAGHVIMSVGIKGIVLKACTEEGIMQVGAASCHGSVLATCSYELVISNLIHVHVINCV